MIPGTCPDCGGKRPLPDYLADAEARAALAAALDCPAPLARLIIPYLQLHSPPSKAMQMGKLTRLLRELADLVATGTVTRERETVPASLALWQAGLEQVLANRDAGTVDLPLSGHGYLVSIVHRQARAAGARDRRENAPLHPSHAPAAVAAPPKAKTDGAGDDPERALADYRATQTLLAGATGIAATALRAQLSAQRRRLSALGVAPLDPPAEDPQDAR